MKSTNGDERLDLIDAILDYEPRPSKICIGLDHARYLYAKKMFNIEKGTLRGPTLVPEEETRLKQHIQKCAYCRNQYDEDLFFLEFGEQVLPVVEHQKAKSPQIFAAVREKETKYRPLKDAVLDKIRNMVEALSPVNILTGAPVAAASTPKSPFGKKEMCKVERILYYEDKVAGKIVFERLQTEIRAIIKIEYKCLEQIRGKVFSIKDRQGKEFFSKLRLSEETEIYTKEGFSDKDWNDLIEVENGVGLYEEIQK